MQQQETTTLTPAQFARASGLSLNRVYALLWEGRVSAEKTDGVWQIPASELQKRQKAVPA
jgi:hypothetical protein